MANLAPSSVPQVLFLESVILWYAAKCGLSILSHTVVNICVLKGQDSKKLISFAGSSGTFLGSIFCFYLFLCVSPCLPHPPAPHVETVRQEWNIQHLLVHSMPLAWILLMGTSSFTHHDFCTISAQVSTAGKGRWHLSSIPLVVLTARTPLQGSRGPPGVCRRHSEVRALSCLPWLRVEVLSNLSLWWYPAPQGHLDP